MNVIFSKYTYLDKEKDKNQLKTNVYLLITLGEDKYHFEYNDLTEEQLIQDSMTIVSVLYGWLYSYVSMALFPRIGGSLTANCWRYSDEIFMIFHVEPVCRLSLKESLK